MSGQQNVGANTSSNDASKPPKVVQDDAIAEARKAIIAELLQRPEYCPHFIRIAFFDAISYNPIAKVDGPNGSIRIWEGLAKEGEMKKAIEALDNLKATKNSNVWPYVSYADLYQLAGIEAVKKAGGPSIEFQYGRTDSCTPILSSKIPIINDDIKADSLKATFHRIGFTDKEIVALSSAYYYWTNYAQFSQLNFNTSYYEKLLELSKPEASNAANTSNATNDKQPRGSPTNNTPTLHYWKCLLSDASFRKHVELFAKDANSFAKEYASAHKKLSELGFKHFPEPILTEVDYHDVKHGIAFAVAMTILFGFVGFFYEVMRA